MVLSYEISTLNETNTFVALPNAPEISTLNETNTFVALPNACRRSVRALF
jgi:hypothetical protein